MGMTTGNDLDLTTLLGPPWARLVRIETGGGSGGGSGDDDGDEGEGDEDDGDEDDGDDGDEERTFTQADLDTQIAKARREERKRLKARGGIFGRKGKGDDGKGDQGDEDDPKALRREISELSAKYERSELMAAATDVALDAGADPKRVKRFLRQADLDGVSSDDADAIEAAIEDALEENPEFRAKDEADDDEADDDGKGKGKGNPPKRKRARSSTRDDSGGNGKRQWTRADIAKIAGTAEYEEHRDEILKQIKAGSVK